MKCKYCGNEVQTGSIFCSFCGERLVRTRRNKDEVKVPSPVKRGQRWRIKLEREGVSATFDTPEECVDWAKAVRRNFLKTHKRLPKKTLGGAIDDYIELNKNILSPATIREYKRSKDAELLPIRDMEIADITDAVLQKFVNDYAADHGAKTVVNYYRRVARVIRSVDRTRIFNVNLPARNKPEIHVPSEKEIKALYEAVKDTKMEIPFLLAATGSLRRGEISALTKDDIVPGGVHIWRDMVKGPDDWVIKNKPKTSDSVRTANLPPFVMEKLGQIDGDRICNMNPNTITANFNRLEKRHGLPPVSFHSLRHYWASVAHTIMPDSYVLANGGWSTMDTPRKVYIKTLEAENAKMASKVNEKFAQTFAQSP